MKFLVLLVLSAAASLSHASHNALFNDQSAPETVGQLRGQVSLFHEKLSQAKAVFDQEQSHFLKENQGPENSDVRLVLSPLGLDGLEERMKNLETSLETISIRALPSWVQCLASVLPTRCQNYLFSFFPESGFKPLTSSDGVLIRNALKELAPSTPFRKYTFYYQVDGAVKSSSFSLVTTPVDASLSDLQKYGIPLACEMVASDPSFSTLYFPLFPRSSHLENLYESLPGHNQAEPEKVINQESFMSKVMSKIFSWESETGSYMKLKPTSKNGAYVIDYSYLTKGSRSIQEDPGHLCWLRSQVLELISLIRSD